MGWGEDQGPTRFGLVGDEPKRPRPATDLQSKEVSPAEVGQLMGGDWRGAHPPSIHTSSDTLLSRPCPPCPPADRSCTSCTSYSACSMSWSTTSGCTRSRQVGAELARHAGMWDGVRTTAQAAPTTTLTQPCQDLLHLCRPPIACQHSAGDCYIVAGGLMRTDDEGFTSLDFAPDAQQGAMRTMSFAKVG